MKKMLYALLALPLLFAACTKEKTDSTPPDTTPTVSFDKPIIPLVQGEAVLTLVVTNFDVTTMADDAKIEVKLTLGGTAGSADYSLNLKSFLLKAKSPRVTLTLTSENFSTEAKVVELTLQAPEGFKLGKIPTTKVNLDPRKAYYFFTTASAEMHDQYAVAVNLQDDLGKDKYADDDLNIPLVVDGSSTAVEGVNFEFEEGTPELTVYGDEMEGTVNIKLLKYEAGKNKIVLDLGDVDGYIKGEPSRITLTMNPSYWDLISGTYSVESLVTTQDFMKKIFGSTVTTFVGFPQLNTADKITFDSSAGTLTPNLQSELKNFFIGESKMVNMGMSEVTDLETMLIQVPVFMIDLNNCNRNFEAGKNSAKTEAYIGIRIVKNEAQEDRLELYLMDYEPTTFMTELYSFEGFQKERPTATGAGAYLLYILKKE